ncbi:MAG: hypothetical protein R3E87_18020 [Burkholderiaceae bacterium]
MECFVTPVRAAAAGTADVLGSYRPQAEGLQLISISFGQNKQSRSRAGRRIRIDWMDSHLRNLTATGRCEDDRRK